MNNNKIFPINEFILNVVNRLYPNKYKSKFNNAYYLKHMITVLRDVHSWNSLGNILKESYNVSKFHHKRIYNVFLKWSKNDVFKIAYNELLNSTLTYNSNSTIDLFIDTSNINNKYGIQDIDYGINKKKRVSKLSLICDINKNVLSVSMHNGKIHDVKTINPSVNNLLNFRYRKINLIGDKGYVTKDIKQELKQKKINLIYPKRKNQVINEDQEFKEINKKKKQKEKDKKKKEKNKKSDKKNNKKNKQRSKQKKEIKLLDEINKDKNKKNKKKDKTSKYDKNKLSNRYIIEHVNQNIKKFDRISLRKDKSNISYISNIYLALLMLFPLNNQKKN